MTYPFVSEVQQAHSSLITDELRQWAAEHYRTRTFFREERIPTRSGLLYFINSGFVRLESTLKIQTADNPTTESTNTVIAFLGEDQPIDIFDNEQISFQAIAQTDRTEIFWVYWQDLERWRHLKRTVLQHLQYQHQRQLILRSILGQRKSIDQLLYYLDFLAYSYGQMVDEGRKIPFLLTHEQLASVLGTTRVTVSRLLGQLRDEGKICMISEQYFCVRQTHF